LNGIKFFSFIGLFVDIVSVPDHCKVLVLFLSYYYHMY
jgi:hypothetical protein